MISINLNTILIITLLLIVIIILSSIKICNNPLKQNNNLNKNDRFIDQKYSYISEPFEGDAVPTPDFAQLLGDSNEKKFNIKIDQEKQNINIKELESSINKLENKINVLSQVW
jgi:hypothetical protein